MSSISGFLRLSREDRRLFIQAFVIVALVRLGLTFASYKWTSRWLISTRPHELASIRELSRIARFVRSAAKRIPHASCLTQALAGQFLLALQGKHSTIRIGVKPDEHSGLAAHAWLMSGDTVVLGGTTASLRAYSTLADLGAAQ